MRLLNRIALPMLFAVFLVCAAHSVLAAPVAKYPGSKLTLEVNLTDKDFLPIVKQFLTTVPAAIPAEMKANAPIPVDQLAADISAAFAGLKMLKVSGYAVQTADSAKIAEFYGEKTGAGKDWKPLTSFSGMNLFLQPGTDRMFVLLTHPGGYFTIDTMGPIDFARLMKVGAQLMPLVAQSAAQAPAGNAAAVVRGTDYGSEGSCAAIGMTWEVHGNADVTMQLADGKGGWQDSGEISTSPADAPAVPRLIVRSKTGNLSIGGYATYEVHDALGKPAMRLIIKSSDPKAQPAPSEVRIVTFEPDQGLK